MNALEITDIIDVYYDGRKPFAELPKAPTDEESRDRGEKSNSRRSVKPETRSRR